MRTYKTIRLVAFGAGFALASQNAFADQITAVLQGQANGIISPGWNENRAGGLTISSGTSAAFDLSASFFDFSSPNYSSNANGIIDQYRFNFGDGTSTAWMTTASANHFYTGNAGELFAVSGAARWSGAPDEISTDSLIIKLSSGGTSPAPGAPVAVLKGPYIYYENSPTLFDGTSSYDPDGDQIISYRWDFQNNGNFSDATGPQASCTFSSRGINIIGLEVFDGQSWSAPVYTEVGTTADFGLPADWPYNTVNAPVPEPETYTMLFSGLSLLGFMGRRRKQKTTA
ncbi:MAG: PKD domain-containing protein [Desulfobacteraceae bacterium]|nr:PKD domain-containing protein [Desulfobacteraceae bacterium]